jgi:hypothetical protein
MPTTAFTDGRFESGLTFDSFLRRAEERAETSTPGEAYHEYRRLNVQRMHRVLKTYSPSPTILSAVESIDSPQRWLVITEDWCGDSSQTLPAINAIAALSPLVRLSILDRDTHPDVMDAYLTNGTRGIPKLVAADAAGNELWTWGPRPLPAQDLVQQHKSVGTPKETMYADVHAWYARNRQEALEQELATLILQTKQQRV